MTRNKLEDFRVLSGMSGNLTEAVGFMPTVGTRQSDYNQKVIDVLEDIQSIDFDDIDDVGQIEKMIQMLEGFDASKLTGQTRRDYEQVLSELGEILEGIRKVKAVTRTGKVIKMKRRTVIPGAERMANKKRARKNRAKAKIYRKKMARKVDRGKRKRAMLQKESMGAKLRDAITEATTLRGHDQVLKYIRNAFAMINFLASDNEVKEQLDTLWDDIQNTIVEGVSEDIANTQYVKALKAIQTMMGILEIDSENF